MTLLPKSPLIFPTKILISRRTTRPRTLTVASSKETERGLEFDTGGSFFRRESSVGRDLGALAASIHSRSLDHKLRILDAMCGCGIRSLRYLAQSDAGFVWTNDACEDYRGTIIKNLSGVADRVSEDGGGGRRRWVVTHNDANRVLLESYINREYFDLVDIDSFGSDSSFIRSAIMAVREEGLLYLTNTDGFSSGGHRPYHSLASYGAYVRPMPYSNEVGLRMLIGGALREATALGFCVSPLFSYYSYHGPVFRVMFRVSRRNFHKDSQYGFICYCNKCGNSQAFSWRELGQICCPCSNKVVSRSLVVSGPMWTGPLHDATFLAEMLDLAGEWRWAYTKEKGIDLEKLLNRMIDESDSRLPSGYIKLDEIASRGKINSPPVSMMISSLQKEGYAASRSHIAPNAIKTNCPIATCIQISRELRHANNSFNHTVPPLS